MDGFKRAVVAHPFAVAWTAMWLLLILGLFLTPSSRSAEAEPATAAFLADCAGASYRVEMTQSGQAKTVAITCRTNP